MKKRVSALFCALMAFFCFARPAMAALPYLSASAGLGMLGDSGVGSVVSRSYDTGTLLIGAFGIDNGPVRLEAEAGYRKNGVTNSPASITMKSYMANGYLDLGLPFSPLKPFVLAGGGVATVDEHNSGLLSGDTVLAWQIGAGAAYSLAPAVTLDVQYRYFDASTPQLAGYRYSMGSHNILLGLRFGL